MASVVSAGSVVAEVSAAGYTPAAVSSVSLAVASRSPGSSLPATASTLYPRSIRNNSCGTNVPGYTP